MHEASSCGSGNSCHRVVDVQEVEIGPSSDNDGVETPSRRLTRNVEQSCGCSLR